MKTIFLFCGWLVAVSLINSNAEAQTANHRVFLRPHPHVETFPEPGEPQVIHSEDGVKLTLLGTSFGHNHMAPGFEDLNTATWIYTPEDSLVVWLKVERPPGIRTKYYELLVTDRLNSGYASIEPRQDSFVSSNVLLESFVLSAYPRWDMETVLRVRPHGEVALQGQFVMRNPVPVTIKTWAPDALPMTKSSGDFAMTLTDLKAAIPIPYTKGAHPPDSSDPANRCVRLHFSATHNGQPATNWDAWLVRVTDTYGNFARGSIHSYPKGGIFPAYPDRRLQNASNLFAPPALDGYFFQPSLWPYHPWKMELEFICQSNFNKGEIVTLTNLPVTPGTHEDWEKEWDAWDVGKTNLPFTVISAQVNGVHLKILPPLEVPDQPAPGETKVDVIIGTEPGYDPRGMNMTVLSVTDEQGHALWNPFKPSWAGHYSLDFPADHPIKSINLILALHKSRFVEFTVQPSSP